MSLTVSRLRRHIVGVADPTVYTIGAIRDFRAVDVNGNPWVGVGDLYFQFTPASGATDEEYQLLRLGSTWEDPSNLEDFQLLDLEDASYFWARVRGLAGADKGPWSNISAFQTFMPKLELRDYKTVSVSGGSQQINLDAMDGGALARSVGDVVVVVAQCRNSSAGTIVNGAATGWNHIVGSNDGTQNASRALWKIIDGTEVAFNVLTKSGGGTQRITHWALSFRVRGDVELGDSPSSNVTSADPAAQNIPCADSGGAVVAISVGGAQSSVPGLSFTDDSLVAIQPSLDLTNSQASGTPFHSKLKVKYYTFLQTAPNIVTNQSDGGVNLPLSFYLVARE